MDARLAIVVLNYKTPGLTIDCLGTIAPQVTDDWAVLVVDNDSPDASADQIEEQIEQQGWGSWAQVIRSPVNDGFAAGNNVGIRAIDAEAYLLLNSDTLLLPGALAGLTEALERYPQAGLIAPAIQRADGKADANTFRFPHPVTELIRTAKTGPVTRLLRRFDGHWPMADNVGRPDWVGFACVLVRRAVIDRVGLLDDGFFMYFEDVDYCHRVWAAGWEVLFFPGAHIIHLLGSSSQVTAEGARQRRAPRFYYAARARYFAKYHGRHGLWLANACWYLGRSISLVRERLEGKAPHVREKEGRDIWIDCWAPLAPRPAGPPT